MRSRRRFLFLFLSTTLFFSSVAGSSDRMDADALGVRMGESLQGLMDAYNLIGVPASERPDSDTLIYLRTLDPLEGTKRVEYSFRDGILCKAMIYLNGGKGECPTDVFQKVRNGLIYRYGKPRSDGMELLFHVTRWEFPKMSVQMTEAPCETMGGVITTEIILTYTHRPGGWEGTAKGE